MLLGLVEASARRSGAELLHVVRPFVLRTDPEPADRFQTIADHRPAVTVDGALHVSLVVVDEQPRRQEILEMLGHLLELVRRGDRVGRAAAQPTLVVDGWALGAQVRRGRQVRQYRRRRGERVVPGIGQIGDPAQRAAGHGLAGANPQGFQWMLLVVGHRNSLSGRRCRPECGGTTSSKPVGMMTDRTPRRSPVIREHSALFLRSESCSVRRPARTEPTAGGHRDHRWTPELDRGVWAASNDSFGDHSGSVPMDHRRWRHLFADSARFRPGASRVALDPAVGWCPSCWLRNSRPTPRPTVSGPADPRLRPIGSHPPPAARRPGPVPAGAWFILRSVTRQLPRSPR